jgi:hypothetical protein
MKKLVGIYPDRLNTTNHPWSDTAYLIFKEESCFDDTQSVEESEMFLYSLEEDQENKEVILRPLNGKEIVIKDKQQLRTLIDHLEDQSRLWSGS